MFHFIMPEVLNLYRTNGYLQEYMDIQASAQPPSFAGDIYFSLHPGRIQTGPVQHSVEWGLDELFFFHVTISRKVGVYPRDFGVEPLLDPLDLHGTYTHERKLKTVIQNNWPTLICAINTRIDDTTENEQKLALMSIRWAGTTDPQDQGPEWFGSDPSENPTTGYSLTLEFGPLRRVQSEITETPLV